jgi:hypothetical protein
VLDVDVPKDLFHIAYDPGRITPETILGEVRKQGFEGEVVPGEPMTDKKDR